MWTVWGRSTAEMERNKKKAEVEGGDQEQGGRTEEGHTWAGGEQSAGKRTEA